MTSKARRIVTRAVRRLHRASRRYCRPTISAPGDKRLPQQARQVADYIAGMTDRYAMREHKRLFLIDEM